MSDGCSIGNNNQFKKQTDHRLSSMAVGDSLFRYLRLCLLSMYVKAAKITSTNNDFVKTS